MNETDKDRLERAIQAVIECSSWPEARVDHLLVLCLIAGCTDDDDIEEELPFTQSELAQLTSELQDHGLVEVRSGLPKLTHKGDEALSRAVEVL